MWVWRKDRKPLQTVQMAIPFTFRSKRFLAGSWIVFGAPRRAMTPAEYAKQFPPVPQPQW